MRCHLCQALPAVVVVAAAAVFCETLPGVLAVGLGLGLAIVGHGLAIVVGHGCEAARGAMGCVYFGAAVG